MTYIPRQDAAQMRETYDELKSVAVLAMVNGFNPKAVIAALGEVLVVMSSALAPEERDAAFATMTEILAKRFAAECAHADEIIPRRTKAPVKAPMVISPWAQE